MPSSSEWSRRTSIRFRSTRTRSHSRRCWRLARAATSLAREHTQSRYRTAFHKPLLSDWRNYETWEEAGSPQLPGKANAIWKELLAAYEPPPMDEARRDELQAFVDRRKAEGGVPTDF